MAVALLAAVTLAIGIAAPVVFAVFVGENTPKTSVQLESLKMSLNGNPRLVIEQGRADFGYVGNMGNAPSQLNQLWLKGAQNGYVFDTTVKVGAGWLGPYFPNALVDRLLALDKDYWGNDLIYISTPFQRSSDNQTVAARIQSVGPDGVKDTSDDIIVDTLKGEIFSTVAGKLFLKTQPAKFATVTLNQPSNGTITTRSTTTDANGVFTFTDVTFGIRSVSVDPKLTYADGSARANPTGLKFTVTNYGTNAVTITSIKLTYTTSPVSYYEQIKIGTTIVFDYNNNLVAGVKTRKGSGETVTFAGISVEGSGRPNQVIPFRVEQEKQTTPDLFITGVGRSTTIDVSGFKNQISGSAQNVSVSGVMFTVDFSDGSQISFTP